ncbi:hypothetical protein [Hoylesella saccharolytica]|nr:hypothetical protein [Hoylesella saccharolytica]DAR71663.1 MAG TPA: hypothetical protein [Caudoviricetes sp.]
MNDTGSRLSVDFTKPDGWSHHLFSSGIGDRLFRFTDPRRNHGIAK